MHEPAIPQHAVRANALTITLVGAAYPTTALAQAKEVITFRRRDLQRSRARRSAEGVGRQVQQEPERDRGPADRAAVLVVREDRSSRRWAAAPGLTWFASTRSISTPRSRRTASCQLDEIINDRRLQVHGARPVHEGGRQALRHAVRDQQLRPAVQPDARQGSARRPANFDEFVATAKAATGNGVYGFAYRATMAEGPGFWQDLCNFVYGFGGRWSDEQGNLTLNSPKVIEGVTAYKKMYDAGVTPKGTDAATYRRMFWEGKLAMEIDNGGVAGIFNQQAPDLPLAAAPSPFPTRAQGLDAGAAHRQCEHQAQGRCVHVLQMGAATREPEAAAGSARSEQRRDRSSQRSPEDLAKKPWLKVYDEQTPNSVPQLGAGPGAQDAGDPAESCSSTC